MPYAPDLSGCALDGRYELHAVIGEGAFGRVYSGCDRRLERPVAIKLIKPWWAEDPEWVRSFEREAQLLARVSDPGIVQIFDVGHAAEGLYYVSELVDGESLASRLRRGPLAGWEAAAIAEQLCRALGQAHARSVVHRDVKPANILIAADGRVKVGDFGVARLAEGSSDGGSLTASIVGTPRYMAPEQARGRHTTPATDVYSAGIVLYEMLSGRPPFTERSVVELALRHLNDRPGPLPRSTPASLRPIVERALAKRADKRYRDGGEMADALSQALRGAPARARGEIARGARPRPGPGSDASDLRPRSHSSDPRPAPGSTRRAPKLSPRRNVNPSARRRSVAALTFAFGVLAAMIVGAVVLGSAGRVRVPSLHGLSRSSVRARAHRLSLLANFSSRYDAAGRKGTVIAQTPRAGRRVAQGSTLAVVLSRGPRPVAVPDVAGESAALATAAVEHRHLVARVVSTVAPDVTAGTVTSQLPGPGSKLTPGSSVRLNVAEVPHWQPLSSLAGSAHGQTIQFHVRGGRWRLVYTMNYVGTCTFVIFCNGPSATVTNVAGGGAQSGFDLNDGGRQTRTFTSGPGVYRLSVAPGSDTARWSLWVEDYY